MVVGGSDLHGRDRELATLDALLVEATAGRSFAAVMEGEAGIGKSRLLKEVESHVDDSRLAVIACQAFELEAQRPFGPLVDAFGLRSNADDPAAGAIAEMIRASADPSAPRSSVAVFEVSDAIVDLAQRRTQRRPAVLIVDDAQWADAATVMTLGMLVRSRSHLALSVLITARPSPRSGELRALVELVKATDGTVLRLESLAADDVAALAAAVLEAPPGTRLQRHLTGAAGNPFYVLEVVSALQAEGAINTSTGTAELETNEMPTSLAITVLRRLGFLPVQTIDTLRAAAILGSTFHAKDVAALAETTVATVLERLRPAVDASIVLADGDALRFRHDLIHQAVYEDIPRSAREALHLEAASALAAAGASTISIATQFARGTTGPNTEAASWLELAAYEVGTNLADSGRFARLAAARTPPSDLDARLRRQITALSFEVEWSVETADEAELRAVLARCVKLEDTWRVEAALCQFLFTHGRLEDARALALASPRPRFIQAVMMSGVCISLAMRGQMKDAVDTSEQLLTLVIDDKELEAAFGERWRTEEAFHRTMIGFNVELTRCTIAWMQGRSLAAVGHADAARDDMHRMLAVNGPQPGDAQAMFAYVDAGVDTWRTISRATAAHAAHTITEIDVAIGQGHFLASEWDDALASFEVALARALESGRTWSLNPACAFAALISWHRGDDNATQSWLEYSVRGRALILTRWVEALRADTDGDAARALETIQALWHKTPSGLEVMRRYYGADAVRFALAAGDAGFAREVTKHMRVLAELAGTGVAEAVALRCEGLIEERADALLDAAELYRAAGWSPYAAATAEDAAAALALSGNLPRARTVLDQALGVYDVLGGTRARSRALVRLRSLGVVRRERAPTNRPTSGWQSLTDAERRVVELVAEGRTYRDVGETLFISRRTVETHVARVFTKLNVASKSELVAAYLRDNVTFG